LRFSVLLLSLLDFSVNVHIFQMPAYGICLFLWDRIFCRTAISNTCNLTTVFVLWFKDSELDTTALYADCSSDYAQRCTRQWLSRQIHNCTLYHSITGHAGIILATHCNMHERTL